MKARVVVGGHAVHPMLIVFPLGLLSISVVWDICRLATDEPKWGLISFWTIVAGVLGGVVAAIPGLIDWLAIPEGTRARRVGLYHMVLNLAVVALFVISLVARWNNPGGYEVAGVGRMFYGWVAVLLAIPSGWLGGELIERLGVSVHDGAHPDAPSSLSATTAGHPRGQT